MKFPGNVYNGIMNRLDLSVDMDHSLDSGIFKGLFILAFISNIERCWALVEICTL